MKNEQDFRNLDRAIEENPQMKILWKYVPAHIGICGNERADELARKGALAYKKWYTSLDRLMILVINRHEEIKFLIVYPLSLALSPM